MGGRNTALDEHGEYGARDDSISLYYYTHRISAALIFGSDAIHYYRVECDRVRLLHFRV